MDFERVVGVKSHGALTPCGLSSTIVYLKSSEVTPQLVVWVMQWEGSTMERKISIPIDVDHNTGGDQHEEFGSRDTTMGTEPKPSWGCHSSPVSIVA